jgi:hypothetical protein
MNIDTEIIKTGIEVGADAVQVGIQLAQNEEVQSCFKELLIMIKNIFKSSNKSPFIIKV